MIERNLIGQKLGQYELYQQIIAGNLSEVYEAQQTSINRRVAVKVLNPIYQAQANYVEAFIRDATMMAELEHPHIVPIYDFGTDRGITYAVQRLLTGGTLWDRIKKDVLALHEISSILKQVANGLDYAHSYGIVQGNPTPGNVRFDQRGIPYLVNFLNVGLLSQSTLINKYVAYISPERWKGESATSASDQYALGSIVYEMLTGHVTFNDRELMVSSDKAFHTLPQVYRPEIPLAVNNVLNRALAKNPEDRYPTVMDFAREFEKAMLAVPKHLFISYSRHDKDYAQQVCDYLSHNGFEVWIDSKIEYGTTWFEEIDEAIKNCAAFVPVMTPESRNSDWVRKEILLAMDYKKPIFPLLLEGDRFPILVDIQFADVKGGTLPDVEFHRRLRRTVYGDA